MQCSTSCTWTSAVDLVTNACMNMLGFSIHWRQRATRLCFDLTLVTSQQSLDIAAFQGLISTVWE